MTDWEGAFNLRDLGGLPLADGGATAHGRVYRSGRTETLTDAGWSALRAAGVRTIVDLRNAPERARRDTDPVLVTEHAAGVVVVHAPTEDPDDAEFMRVCGPWLDHPRSYADNTRLYPERFAAVFTALAASEGSALFHCAGGRDRTGMIAAMLLSLAEVEREAILLDYAAGFREASRRHARDLPAVPIPGQGGYVEPKFSDEEIETRIADRVAALDGWLSELDVRSYLRDAGMTASDVDALARRLRD
ncbi:tyrosine-protein phosphatase [Microbacterium sp. M28]|uniref:tyrosine-protein phosphatase n=1 Tax=Microbacterium sp. M28 TaxID=2962064 RepID=UPI0021F40F3D|nr:tyrosine-protein phosphatase [Microbacterium sp. M28]UYO97727.1 tyrosine-protein phosphatase [Microbacterium sp. M28]